MRGWLLAIAMLVLTAGVASAQVARDGRGPRGREVEYPPSYYGADSALHRVTPTDGLPVQDANLGAFGSTTLFNRVFLASTTADSCMPQDVRAYKRLALLVTITGDSLTRAPQFIAQVRGHLSAAADSNNTWVLMPWKIRAVASVDTASVGYTVVGTANGPASGEFRINAVEAAVAPRGQWIWLIDGNTANPSCPPYLSVRLRPVATSIRSRARVLMTLVGFSY